jgi:preprotein translocase subunit SecE
MAEEISFPQKAASWPTRVKDYFEELQMEMRKVTWPSWKQVRSTTAVVIASVFAFSAYFFVVDNLISRVINKLFDTFTK